MLAFTGVKPVDDVLELVPGTGYWTRIQSDRRPGGHVYTVWPHVVWPNPQAAKRFAKGFADWQKRVKMPHYNNVSLLQQPAAMLSAQKRVDIVFTDDNYHDYHNPSFGPVDIVQFDKQVYAALKPGGVFVIVDHRAPADSGTSDTNTLHRIDPAVVKQEVESVGFVFDGSSDALLNPKDPLTLRTFDKTIRGHTSQFIYRFRKPKG